MSSRAVEVVLLVSTSGRRNCPQFGLTANTGRSTGLLISSYLNRSSSSQPCYGGRVWHSGRAPVSGPTQRIDLRRSRDGRLLVSLPPPPVTFGQVFVSSGRIWVNSALPRGLQKAQNVSLWAQKVGSLTGLIRVHEMRLETVVQFEQCHFILYPI